MRENKAEYDRRNENKRKHFIQLNKRTENVCKCGKSEKKTESIKYLEHQKQLLHTSEQECNGTIP